MGVFFSGLRQFNALRGDVEVRLVCRYKWVCFSGFDRGVFFFGGIISFVFIYYKVVYACIGVNVGRLHQ